MLQTPNVDTSTKMPRSQPDHELVASTKSGDTDAFGILVAKYQKRVFRVAHTIMRNREDAEDVTQDVFFKAFQRLHGFEGRAAFSTWLTRIAVNESLMQLRSRRAVMVSLDEPADGDEKIEKVEVRDPGLSPEQLCSQNESWHFLVAALNALRPALRIVFVLRDIEGCSGKETAEILGLSDEVAKSRLFRARQALRSLLMNRVVSPCSLPRIPFMRKAG